MILILIVTGLAVLVTYDLIQKKKINDALNEAKIIVSNMALNLTTERISSPVTISPKYLAAKSDSISNITIYPDNYLKVVFNNEFIGNDEKVFTFRFESIDKLSRGHLTCEGGDVSVRILPNMCRQ